MESSLVPPPLVSNPPPPPPQPNSQVVDDAERSAFNQTTVCTMTRSATDILNFDLLHTLMEHVDSVSTLRALKSVSKDFVQPARNTLTNVEWLMRNNISLHFLLKQGTPSPALAAKLAKASPGCLMQRDGDGLLPLQFAAAYKSRFGDALLSTIREVTVRAVPGSVWPARSDEARGLRKGLRPVRTRVSGVIVAA